VKHIIPYVAILIVLLYGLYNAFSHRPDKKESRQISKSYKENALKYKLPDIKEELQRITTTAYTKEYITDVINHGSSILHFKPEEIMEKGFASPQDAPKIACYVLSLAGEKCDTPYPKDAAMFYTSNCAGCHGEDGKGINGAYPDLTRRPMLGIEKRKESLERLLKTL